MLRQRVKATQRPEKMTAQFPEARTGGGRAGHNHDIAGKEKIVLDQAEDLTEAPTHLVAHNRLAHFSGDGHTKA